MRTSKTWQGRHDIAAAHGLRFLRRGGGLVLEDIASGETTTASSVNNQLSLGRAEKHLGPYQPSRRPLPPDVRRREAMLHKATTQAEFDHQRRRLAITTNMLAGAERARWLDASQVALRQDHQLGHNLGSVDERSHALPQPRSHNRKRLAVAQPDRARPIPTHEHRNAATTEIEHKRTTQETELER